jgi:hypothetical protein
VRANGIALSAVRSVGAVEKRPQRRRVGCDF